MPLRVGVDLVSVGEVEESVRMHADRYLTRIYTDRELDDCRTSAGIDSARLAARFAAKEAALKVLRPRDVGIPWRAIEVVRDPSGFVELELHGPAAELAAAAGIESLAVSFTHESGFASAIVAAELRSPGREGGA
jgi:holo-[acyl-carrier protein] synthase